MAGYGTPQGYEAQGRVARPEDVTPAWLQAVLGCGPVTAVATERIGTGQMSESHRLSITYADPAEPAPATLVLKVAAADEQSRATGLALGLYEREVRFYGEVAPRIGGPLAPCRHAWFDPATGEFALLLGDAGPAEQGDEVRGCGAASARLAVAELGRLHAPAIGQAVFAESEWLTRESPVTQAMMEGLLAGFLERYGDRIETEHRTVAEALVASFDAYLAAQADALPGLVHGDYRLDNLLFGQAGADRPLTVVDWQTVTWGPALTDLSYFLGCALTVADRRALEDELLGVYEDALGGRVARAEIDDGVRRQAFFGVMMAVISPMLVQRTERGDAMFMAMFARHCEHVLDRDALAVLPAPERPAPLAVDPADEGAHPPGPERLWNESWYFDAADPEQGVGLYFRIGVDPAAGRCWHTTLVCGPDRPTVALLDFAAPLPAGDALVVSGERVASRQDCVEPLQRYRVRVEGRAGRYADPAGLLRGDAADGSLELALDLEWTTAGAPYQYRLATRYEIPCTVSGTVRIGDEVLELRGVPGQRDHSWGVRDWWSMGWVWSAGHLGDGTHLHALDLRLPGAPRLGAGYVQRGEEVHELTAAPATESLGPDGLGGPTRQDHAGLEVAFEPLGHGPLRLVDDDGRVALFPRAWGRLRTPDGRTGAGWMEWNLGGAGASAD